MKSIEEIEKMVQECQQAIEEIKRGESGVWKPSDWEEYFFVDLDYMKIRKDFWSNDTWDNIRLENKVIFKTEEEAEEYLEYLEIKKKAINEFSKEEWKDNDIVKYAYIFCHAGNLETVVFYTIQYHNVPYFRSKEEAQYFINKYEKFIKREMGI